MADDLEREPAADAAQEDAVAEEVSVEQQLAETDEPAAAEQARADADEADAPPTEEQAAGESRPLDETEQELLARLERELGDGIVESADAFGMLVVRVKPDAWRRAAEVSKRELECDYLSFIAGIDWQPAPREGEEAGGDTSSPVQPTEMTFGVAGSAGRLQVFAHVESTKRRWGVTLKTDVDERDPRAESWVTTYPGADWHERECWEMFGVAFDGHPSLRHLYLPSEFEGHPLRKDYPLLARVVKPWPGLVDVEPMPGEEQPADAAASAEADKGDGADADKEESS
ncbi:MAG TPA: NADH-quinone oxidoreductase subunit C [Acidimicrobiia bacterium]|nr:NADH-quinone oxidoreductase subunit C [Acidimicrobiia bacterium]